MCYRHWIPPAPTCSAPLLGRGKAEVILLFALDRPSKNLLLRHPTDAAFPGTSHFCALSGRRIGLPDAMSPDEDRLMVPDVP